MASSDTGREETYVVAFSGNFGFLKVKVRGDRIQCQHENTFYTFQFISGGGVMSLRH